MVAIASRIAIIFGTRPEGIKLAPVYDEMRRREGLEPVLIGTGQHREMLGQVCDIFRLEPEVSLDIMRHGQSLGEVTSRALSGLEEALAEQSPDAVLVQGDTATTFAGAMAGFYHQLRVGHVEAGLRSGNKYSPYPEEVFRRVTTAVANLHFAATDRARENLLRERIDPGAIFVTGNTVIDALLATRERSPSLEDTQFRWLADIDGRVMLVTAHRRENLGVPFTRICTALAGLVNGFEDLHVVFPMHLNPKVRRAATELLGGVERVFLCEPADYVTFVSLMSRADLILTDSGGIQEEAPALGVPVLVARETTERPEGIDAGVARLVGTQTEDIMEAAEELLTSPTAYARMAGAGSPYGDGHAAERICDGLEFVLGMRHGRPQEFAYRPQGRLNGREEDG
ncbi:MAG: UDP-N-acetylglucosamine 2-epimerase (non-hydrolyzing) [Armatimonadota bacterium]|nr:UDP-N-acetylglucosamine 2-epimerase (non-hydrolyzing) [Armatimonadota bacterium]